MPNWFWARGGERRGPVSIEEIRPLVASGQVLQTDLAWTPGMPNWKEVGQLADLNPASPAIVDRIMAPEATPVRPISAAAVAPMPQAELGYYGTQMPPRAEQNLRGHARPTGDVGTWPMDDAMFEQMQQTFKIRKRIYAAAQTFRAIFALNAISTVITAIITVIAMVGTRPRPTDAIALSMVSGFGIAMTILYWFIYSHTLRSRRWAPLTFFILTISFACIYLGLLAIGSQANSARSRPDEAVGLVIAAGVIVLISGALAWVSWRGFSAIRRYLAQPAWCQEIIAAAKM